MPHYLWEHAIRPALLWVRGKLQTLLVSYKKALTRSRSAMVLQYRIRIKPKLRSFRNWLRAKLQALYASGKRAVNRARRRRTVLYRMRLRKKQISQRSQPKKTRRAHKAALGVGMWMLVFILAFVGIHWLRGGSVSTSEVGIVVRDFFSTLGKGATLIVGGSLLYWLYREGHLGKVTKKPWLGLAAVALLAAFAWWNWDSPYNLLVSHKTESASTAASAQNAPQQVATPPVAKAPDAKPPANTAAEPQSVYHLFWVDLQDFVQNPIPILQKLSRLDTVLNLLASVAGLILIVGFVLAGIGHLVGLTSIRSLGLISIGVAAVLFVGFNRNTTRALPRPTTAAYVQPRPNCYPNVRTAFKHQANGQTERVTVTAGCGICLSNMDTDYLRSVGLRYSYRGSIERPWPCTSAQEQAKMCQTVYYDRIGFTPPDPSTPVPDYWLAPNGAGCN